MIAMYWLKSKHVLVNAWLKYPQDLAMLWLFLPHDLSKMLKYATYCGYFLAIKMGPL